MANRTPHIVGGGLGTFRKEAQARAEKERKEQQGAQRREALRKLAKSVTK